MRVIADEQRMGELIGELAGAVSRAAGEHGGEPWALVGIRNRGDEIARRLGQHLEKIEAGENFRGREGVGSLDITLYRDDLSEIGSQAVVRTTDIPFEVDGVNVVLVDDVLMTGRSIRAALASLIDLGRPRRVWLAVLVDRGGRELPIRPDFVALDLTEQLQPGEHVYVHVTPTDAHDQVAVGASG